MAFGEPLLLNIQGLTNANSKAGGQTKHTITSLKLIDRTHKPVRVYPFWLNSSTKIGNCPFY
jgi:hypothetical protein